MRKGDLLSEFSVRGVPLQISEYIVGQSSLLEVSVTPDHIAAFARLSGDFAPVHMDELFAKAIGFEDVLVHGAFLGALVSRFVGMELPGARGILERLDLSFRKPCYAPVNLTITGKVAQISEAVSTIVLQLTIERGPGDVVATAKSWHRILD